ncbi:hypothetical protein SAMN05660209_03922 [Geodermatophilus africanus]|uniref:Uncharacterized protein n=1 Tax=Geodermatophilus africanus TaxID=1137993 RepID=A0A1H3NEU7_9ACTN|nr:hypothetical protein [Geodermatophilus africanus]SDY87378.1 hypothetical protein SAMN05660209_03922 [Geodermatophilus africanus]
MTAALPLPDPAAARGRWGTRALVVGAALAVALLAAETPAANATFSDSAAARSVSVGTGTVAPATQVRVDASCLATTTVITRTFQTYPWGIQQTSYSATSTTASSRSNVELDETVRTDGANGQYTTTRTIKDTELYATARWDLSTSARVTGYRVTAHTIYGPVMIGEPGPVTTSMTRQYDASVTGWSPRLSIDTLTDYGWVGTSRSSNVVTC